jgi:hypothetical protein
VLGVTDTHYGRPAVGDFSTVPGDGVDGYAREAAVRPATWFTPAPRGFSPAEAGLGHALSHCLYYAGAIRHRNAPVRRSDPSGCDEVGADLTINCRQHEDWGTRTRDWTGGRGVDHD